MKLFIYSIVILLCTVNAQEYEFDFDDDSLDMFPKMKPKKTTEEGGGIDLAKIDKNVVCGDHCALIIAQKEIDICSKYMPAAQGEGKKKHVYTADGVYSYYKKFVHRFLEVIHYKDMIDSIQDGYSAHFKLKVDLEKHQIEKLILFSQFETVIENSSIQDVTHALNTMIYDFEQFEPQSRVGLLVERLQNILGIDLMSLFVATITFISLIVLFTITIKYDLMRNLSLIKIIRLIIIVGFFINCVTNYFLLKKKQEIIKRAHLLSKVPLACTADLNTKESSGLFSSFTNMFKVNAKSKECLDHAEAVMIDSFYHIGPFQVLSYTALEVFKQIAIATGEAINEFYSVVGKDLNFIERPMLRLVAGCFMIAILIVILFLIFCNECNILGGLVSTKRRLDQPIIKEEDVRKRIMDEIYNRLALELSHNHRVKLQAIKNYENVDDLVKNIENCVDCVKKEEESKALKVALKMVTKSKQQKKLAIADKKKSSSESEKLKRSSSSESVEILDPIESMDMNDYSIEDVGCDENKMRDD